MDRANVTIPDRAIALVAIGALLFVLVAASGAISSESETAGERCAGCFSCESGDCGEDGEHAPATHHHCCATSCMTHLTIMIPAASAAPAPLVVGAVGLSTIVTAIGRTPETPYRPPRA